MLGCLPLPAEKSHAVERVSADLHVILPMHGTPAHSLTHFQKFGGWQVAGQVGDPENAALLLTALTAESRELVLSLVSVVARSGR